MLRFDPDILVGYEVQMLSWGFLLQRANHLSWDLTTALSRLPGTTLLISKMYHISFTVILDEDNGWLSPEHILMSTHC